MNLPMPDHRVRPLLDELAREYDARYGHLFGRRAFRRHGPETAEFNRIWTHSAHRRRGLARFVLAELEALASHRGYRRVYLTTGPRQPEAEHLYLNSGYEPQFYPAADPGTIKFLAFLKDLHTRS